MFEEVIVAIDGSAESARALRPASAIARYLGVTLRAISYHPTRSDGEALKMQVQRQVAEVGDIARVVEVLPTTRTVAEEIIDVMDESPRALLIMSTRGQGRAAAVVGSVATYVLSHTHRPVLLIGPACDVGRFRLHGPVLVATDNTPAAHDALQLAASAIAAFDFDPSVINVVDRESARLLAAAQSAPGGYDLPAESAMVQRFARELQLSCGKPVEYEVLHADHAGVAIADHAIEMHASMVTMATHARSSWSRLVKGSVMATVLHSVPCPVLAIAPDL